MSIIHASVIGTLHIKKGSVGVGVSYHEPGSSLTPFAATRFGNQKLSPVLPAPSLLVFHIVIIFNHLTSRLYILFYLPCDPVDSSTISSVSKGGGLNDRKKEL